MTTLTTAPVSSVFFTLPVPELLFSSYFPCFFLSIPILHLSCHPPLRSLSPDICCNSHLISCLFICLSGCLHISLFFFFFSSFLCLRLLFLTFPHTYLLLSLAFVLLSPAAFSSTVSSSLLIVAVIHIESPVCLLSFSIYSISPFSCCF